ncbi:MAG TPA: tetratricopeptide repeat protein [Verrucomicrobiae bacterium]|nr:tetratricopeptide repeat protein [Verrucomicrobiae bacterium]
MPPADLNRAPWRRLIGLTLIALTLALYWPVTNHGFINFDDDQYVTGNFHVKAGLSWSGIVWAFQSGYADNWHPLTWISHMLDCQLYGLNPAGHHLTNLLLHIANTVLLFLFLSRTTGTTWRSGFVAALFACHPLHVESVAWVAERKDVLSTFFWLLTLLAYANYAKKPGAATYLLTLSMFVLGLMCKPMVVTLPFVLLLLDFWPLNRFSPDAPRPAKSIGRLVFEKAPFLLLSLASSTVTFLVQRAGGAVSSLDSVPLPFRIANTAISYLRYVSKTFLPVDLAVFYPPPTHWPLGLVIASGLFVLACSVLSVWLARRHPYLLVGWFWYLGTLIPVIGLVQVGRQAMADRYMYVPGIGLFMAIVWGSYALLCGGWQRKWLAPAVGIIALAGCLMATWIQLEYWQNNMTLFFHARAVTANNYVADCHLGEALEEIGQFGKAVAYLEEASRINPNYARGESELGAALASQGKLPEAIVHFQKAVRLRPKDAVLRYNLGTARLNRGQLDEAAAQFSTALQLNPDFAEAHRSLALVLLKQGKTPEALDHFSKSVELNPDDAEAHFDYGLVLLDNNRLTEAAVQFSQELALSPYQPMGHYRLAEALFRQYESREAIAEFWKALRLAPNFPDALNELAWILATDPDPKLRSGAVAVHLAERACDLTHDQVAAMLTTLGAAYAEAGRFPEAIATAQTARDLASASGQKDLADNDEQFLKLYQSRQAYHSGP